MGTPIRLEVDGDLLEAFIQGADVGERRRTGLENLGVLFRCTMVVYNGAG
jgi:hypothetical protein